MLLGCRTDWKDSALLLRAAGPYFRKGFRSRINQVGFAVSCAITAAVLYAMSEAHAPIWASALVGILVLTWLVVFYLGFGGWLIVIAADKHVAGGRIDRAIAAHGALIAFQPMNHMAPAWRGGCLMLARRYDDAAEDFRAAIKLNPRFPRHHLQLAQCQAIRGDVADAIETLDHALASEPRCAWNWQTRGALLLAMGEFEDALHDFSRAIEVAGDSVDQACLLDPAGAFDSSQYARIAIGIVTGQSQAALYQLEQWRSDRGIEVDKALLRGMATGSWPAPDLPDLPPTMDTSNIDHVVLAVMRGTVPLEAAELDRAKDGTLESRFLTCALYYDLGEIALLMHREDQAIVHFKRAMLEGMPAAIGYGLARARLAQLGGLPARDDVRRGPWSFADTSR